MIKHRLASVIASMALASTAAEAATICSLGDITPAASACSGFYDGNLLSNNAGDIAAQTTALAAIGYTFNGDFNSLEKISPLNGSQTVDFATLLQGTTYVAFHFGGGRGGPGNATAFYRLDAGAGLDIINLFYNASSNAVLYSTTPAGVPEPATWGLMLGGFFLTGLGVRRNRSTVAA